MQKRVHYFSVFLLFFGLLLVYSNHFHNSFHFDDSHTIVNNIYIKKISNIPLFFKDGTTFSSLPSNQSYRPVVTTSLAIDYWLGNGLDTYYFHLSTFILFILLGILIFFLCKKIYSHAASAKNVFLVSILTTAWYLLHPANAETINYVIARSDSLSTLFVVLAFVIYAYSPLSRRYYLYVIPIAIGILAKISAIMFAPILWVYILLFEKEKSFVELMEKKNINLLFSSMKAVIPIFIFCGAAYLFVQKMESSTWSPGGTSTYLYIITQPFVIWHYFKTFFFPLWLSADTDWTTFESILNLKAIAGFIFVGLLLVIAIITSKKSIHRPISFGVCWFLLALVPSSSVIPLAEVMNDHRVFFPYIGLAIAVCWTLYLGYLEIIKRISKPFEIKVAVFTTSLLFLSAYGYGTFQRNEIWKTDESLWYDATIKSPKNARALMNYGLSLMAKGDYIGAEKYFTDALTLWPQYAYLHVNMGILKNAIGDAASAEQYYRTALTYRSDIPELYFFYAEFLHKQQRNSEAIGLLKKSIELYRANPQSRYLLMTVYAENNENENLVALAQETLQIIPGDITALAFLNTPTGNKSKLETTLDYAIANPTAENYLNLSLEYYNAGKFLECVAACEEALKINPNFDLAYNNICSAYNMLSNWDKAIEAGQKAVDINPNNQLVKNNLEFSKKQKASQATK